MPPDLLDTYGWRIAFLLGAATLPFGLWLRTQLPETLHDRKPSGIAPAQDASRLRLAQNSIRIMVLGLIVLACGTIGSYIFTYTVTYSQNTLHMKPIFGFVAETGGYVLGAITVLYGGWLSDRFGRWPVNVWGNLLFLVLIYPTFYWVVATRSAFALVVGMTVLGGHCQFHVRRCVRDLGGRVAETHSRQRLRHRLFGGDFRVRRNDPVCGDLAHSCRPAARWHQPGICSAPRQSRRSP